MRLLTNSDFSAHTVPLFNKLNLLDIYKINSIHTGRFMFCYHNKLLPPCFFNLFNANKQVHNYNTRNVDSYRSHACRTNIKQFTVLSRGPKLWNSLPDTIRKAETLSSFRIKKWWNTYLIHDLIDTLKFLLLGQILYISIYLIQFKVSRRHPIHKPYGFWVTPCHWHHESITIFTIFAPYTYLSMFLNYVNGVGGELNYYYYYYYYYY